MKRLIQLCFCVVTVAAHGGDSLKLSAEEQASIIFATRSQAEVLIGKYECWRKSRDVAHIKQLRKTIDETLNKIEASALKMSNQRDYTLHEPYQKMVNAQEALLNFAECAPVYHEDAIKAAKEYALLRERMEKIADWKQQVAKLNAADKATARDRDPQCIDKADAIVRELETGQQPQNVSTDEVKPEKKKGTIHYVDPDAKDGDQKDP